MRAVVHRTGRHLRRIAGAGPLQLLLLAASFAVAGYAGVRLLEDDWTKVALWFVGAAVLHDLVLLPLYALADRCLRTVLRGSARRVWINHVRVPAFLSGLLLLVWFPLISRQRAAHYAAGTGLSMDVFWPRWVVVTAVLFTASGVWLAVRVGLLARRSGAKGRPAQGS